MASQADRLAKIGTEGFELIEQLYGPSRRATAKGYPPKRGRRNVEVEVIPNKYNDYVSREEPIINCKEAAYKYDGVMVVNYPKTPKRAVGVQSSKPSNFNDIFRVSSNGA